jgi:hypothetical protein
VAIHPREFWWGLLWDVHPPWMTPFGKFISLFMEIQIKKMEDKSQKVKKSKITQTKTVGTFPLTPYLEEALSLSVLEPGR